MYFTRIQLRGLTSINLPIVGALPSDPYILKAADGLGPPPVDVAVSQTSIAGGVYRGSKPQSREIVLLIGLNPAFSGGQTVADLRSSLYGMLTPGHRPEMHVDIMQDAAIIATTTGYVAKLEIVPFSKDPQVQLTIACPQPYLQGPTELTIDPGDPSAPEMTNIGTAPSGFQMDITLTATLSFWDLRDASGKYMRVIYPFVPGDFLSFDTRPGSRAVYLYRASVFTNMLPYLDPLSIWYQLHAGLNVFDTSSAFFTWGDVSYRPLYWGI